MSGTLRLGSTGQNVEALDLAYRSSRYYSHVFNSVSKTSCMLLCNPQVCVAIEASKCCDHVMYFSSI
jgi:hypothetical protein